MTGMDELTKAQREMVDSCFATGAAWVTAADSENDYLLQEWVAKAWVERVPPPANFHSLTAYKFTDAGRAALTASRPEPPPTFADGKECEG